MAFTKKTSHTRPKIREEPSVPHAGFRHHVHHSTEGHVCAVKDEHIARAIVAALNKEFSGTFRYEHR